eukprot:Plantae.Rhodophyta-Purpureofilum_apyrenoidigerum.ctg6118.p2 GENE.Plantae.Rhodophyta-Purpureofilum_apyrenoidigerum.ctg6118~~Plantae.Rhodophyta-Purpureofilum_apyrenoidigerum.ctg6118.p2  ORF type:complete len:483 (+),score=89.46 Plantae.Rhodophyta-Purpureofilum_apyrenoidigerum.ctg6118:161-1609(+)
MSGIRRVLPLQPPPPNWQLFELKRLCLEGLKVPMFKNPAILRQALTHQSDDEKAKKFGNNHALESLGDRVAAAVVSVNVARWKPIRMKLIQSFLTTNDRMALVAKKVGLHHAVHFKRDSSGYPRDITILGSTYEAVLGAIMLDHGYKQAEEFIVRTLLAGAQEELKSDYDEYFPRNPYNAMGAELTYWRQQVEKLYHKKPSVPVADMIVEEVRGRNSHNQYWKIRLDLLGVTLGRGDGHNQKRAMNNAVLSALKTMRSPFRTFESGDWNAGDVSRLSASNALKFLKLLGVINDSRSTKNACTVDGKSFESEEAALSWLRSQSRLKLEPDSHYDFGLEIDNERMRTLLSEDDVKDVLQVAKVANEREDEEDIVRKLIIGDSVINLFAIEEAFWSCAVDQKAARKYQLEDLMRLQTSKWLRAQRAERLGFVPTESTIVKDIQLRNTNLIEERMGSGLRLTLAVLMDKHGYDSVRNLMHKITYFE